MTPTALTTLRILIGVAGAALLFLSARTGRHPHDRPNKLVRFALLGLAAAALGIWGGDAMLGFRTYINQWDMYHYYMGARYFPELGYEGLYKCAVLADAENGHASEMAVRRYRDLITNDVTPAMSILSQPEQCKDAFSAARWKEFREDVSYFRSQAEQMRALTGRWNWPSMHADHGFNASPTWCLLGIPLANAVRATDGGVVTLSRVDLVLLAAMWGMVWWAFGWRGAAAAAIFWGTNLPARFGWTTGSLLRHDWLVWMVAGVCLMRRRWPMLAGAAIAYSALLRLFPGLIVIGLLLQELLPAIRTRQWQLSLASRRFAFGAIVALVLLVPLSTLVCARGWSVWAEFAANSSRHMATPMTNHIGLKSLLSYQTETRKAEIQRWIQTQPSNATLSRWDIAESVEREWIAARHNTLAERGLLVVLATLAFVVLLARRVPDLPGWAAMVLAAGLIPFAGDLTCYYYAFLLVFGLLATERPLAGATLCVFAAATQALGLMLPADDSLYRWFSVMVLVVVVAIAWLARPRADLEPTGEMSQPSKAGAE